MDVVGIIVIHDKEIFVSTCRRYRVTSREVSSKEFFEPIGGHGVFNGVSFDYLDAEVVSTCLVCGYACSRYGGLGSLFDFVHVVQWSFNFRGEIFVNSVCCEARPSNIVALLDGSDPCLFDGVSCCCMEIGDEVGDSLGDVCCCLICSVLFILLYEGSLLYLGIVVYARALDPFAVLL